MLVPLLSLALQQLNTHHVKSYVEEATREREREREHHVHLHDEESRMMYTTMISDSAWNLVFLIYVF